MIDNLIEACCVRSNRFNKQSIAGTWVFDCLNVDSMAEEQDYRILDFPHGLISFLISFYSWYVFYTVFVSLSKLAGKKNSSDVT